MISTSRLTAALAYAGAAFFFGVALGERGELGAVQYVFLGGIPIAAVAIAQFAKRSRLEVLAGGLAMVAGIAAGQQAFANAFDECVESAPAVHRAIQQYTATRGEFPHVLSDLDIDLPCDCLLRDSILHYVYNERNYRLWFSNDRITYSATNKAPLHRE